MGMVLMVRSTITRRPNGLTPGLQSLDREKPLDEVVHIGGNGRKYINENRTVQSADAQCGMWLISEGYSLEHRRWRVGDRNSKAETLSLDEYLVDFAKSFDYLSAGARFGKFLAIDTQPTTKSV